jgi:hypothetical protein
MITWWNLIYALRQLYPELYYDSENERGFVASKLDDKDFHWWEGATLIVKDNSEAALYFKPTIIRFTWSKK